MIQTGASDRIARKEAYLCIAFWCLDKALSKGIFVDILENTIDGACNAFDTLGVCDSGSFLERIGIMTGHDDRVVGIRSAID